MPVVQRPDKLVLGLSIQLENPVNLYLEYWIRIKPTPCELIMK